MRSIGGWRILPTEAPTQARGWGSDDIARAETTHMRYEASRLESLERRVRWQGRLLLVLGCLLGLTGLAALQAAPSRPTVVRLEQPVKVVLEDIGFQVRANHPIPVVQK